LAPHALWKSGNGCRRVADHRSSPCFCGGADLTALSWLYSDEHEASIKRFVDFCRKYGSAKLGIQIGHSGRKGSTNPPGKGGKPVAEGEGRWQTVGPSPVGYADWPTLGESIECYWRMSASM
jgi:hypothetical protein